METLRKIWEMIAPYFSGGVAGVLITCVIIPIMRGMLTKATAKLDIEGLLKKQNDAIEGAVNKAVDKVQTISFKQSIQPLVESELVKITEKANEYIEGQVAELRDSNEKIVAALSALGAYFEDSIVPDAKKAAFAEAIAAAKAPVTEQEIVVEKAVEETPAPVKKSKKSEVIR